MCANVKALLPSLQQLENLAFDTRKPEKVRTVILATINKKRRDVPISPDMPQKMGQQNLDSGPWIYDNKRLIVKNVSGAPYGG